MYPKRPIIQGTLSSMILRFYLDANLSMNTSFIYEIETVHLYRNEH